MKFKKCITQTIVTNWKNKITVSNMGDIDATIKSRRVCFVFQITKLRKLFNATYQLAQWFRTKSCTSHQFDQNCFSLFRCSNFYDCDHSSLSLFEVG